MRAWAEMASPSEPVLQKRMAVTAETRRHEPVFTVHGNGFHRGQPTASSPGFTVFSIQS